MQGDSAERKKRPNMGDKLLALFLVWRLRKEPMYGYSLIKEMSDIGLSPHRQSTIYAILSKLEKLGLIKGESRQAGKRIRKMFTTTAKGTELFENVKSRRMKGVMREFIGALLS